MSSEASTGSTSQANNNPSNPTGSVGSVQDSANTEATNPVREAAQEAMRKYKVKVEGQELEVDERELLRGYSHQRAANKAMQEGKQLRKQAEEFISMMKDKQKLFDVLQKLGHDPRALSEEYLMAQIQEEMLDPREKELRDAKSKLKHFEDLDRMQKEAEQKKLFESNKQRYAEDYNKQFIEVLQTSGLPTNKMMVGEVARYIGRAAKLGYELSVKEAAQLVKEDLVARHRALISDSDGDVLMQILGEDVANKVRKWDTSRIRSPEERLSTPPDQYERDRSERSEKKKSMSRREWRKYNQ